MEKFTLDKLPKKVLEKVDMETAFMASRLVIAAERFQVFREFHGKKLIADDIGKKLKIHRKYLIIFLDALVSMGLLVKEGNIREFCLSGKVFHQREVYPLDEKIFKGMCRDFRGSNRSGGSSLFW